MLTLRFESDPRGSDGKGIVFVTEASSFRAYRHPSGFYDLAIPNENDVEITHPIGNGVDCYDRCYVMNENGRTVAHFDVMPVEAREGSAA